MNPFCIPPRTFFLSCLFGAVLGLVFMLAVVVGLAVFLTFAFAPVVCYFLSLLP